MQRFSSARQPPSPFERRLRLSHSCACLTGLILVFSASGEPAQDKVTQEMFAYGGRLRTFHLYVPDSVKADSPAPLLIALHGSGRDGISIVNPWREIARREGIIVVGPNSTDKGFWDLKSDGPDFFEALVKEVEADRRSIDDACTCSAIQPGHRDPDQAFSSPSTSPPWPLTPPRWPRRRGSSSTAPSGKFRWASGLAPSTISSPSKRCSSPRRRLQEKVFRSTCGPSTITTTTITSGPAT